MKRLVIIPILMIAGMMQGYSQKDSTQDKGVQFVQNVTWAEVFQKAKKENKYVFVDCYATWCGPCKYMDKKVYPVDSVGAFMNERFISVRMQMDTTRQDNDEIQQSYGTAHDMGEKYNIAAYPSYLFFSPDGRAVHKDIGAKLIGDFLSIVKVAMDPQQQYYTLLTDYEKGVKNYGLMPTLVNEARTLMQDSLEKIVALDYIHHYLQTLPEDLLWTRDNVLFINRQTAFIKIDDPIFKLFYRDRTNIDSVMDEKYFSSGFINRVLYRDLVKPEVEKGLLASSEPHWHRLVRTMEKNFDGRYVQRNVLHGQLDYYKSAKKWEKYIQYFIQQQNMDSITNLKPGSSTALFLNNAAWEIFEYSTNKSQLQKALSWVNQALTMTSIPSQQAQDIDTKANLLYKLGRKSEGLSLEKQSHTLLPQDKEIAANYAKMKGGLPTWSTE